METSRFDSLVRSLGTTGTDRRTLASLLGGALLATLPLAAGARKDQRGKHKPENDNGRNHHAASVTSEKKKKKKKCKPESAAVTCVGKCGSVTNNCKKAVSCGSCACSGTCAVCFTCKAGSNTPGKCAPDPTKAGQSCGAPGNVCQTNGTCACQDSACANPKPVCGAETCQACTSHAQCQAAGKGGVCCNGSCFAGDCCDNSVCGHATPICTGHTCSACTSTSQCGNKEICDNGACEACDVCPTGCIYESPEQAIKVGWPDATEPITVRICPGTYGSIYKDSYTPNVTLIGAGDGANPTSNTILDGPGNADPEHPDAVVRFEGGGTSTLRGVRITGGIIGGVYNNSNTTLNLTNCTLSGNSSLISAPGGGSGGGISNAGALFVTNVAVEDNSADSRGAGIFNFGSDGGTIAFSGANVIADNVLVGSGAQGSAIYNQGNQSSSSAITGLGTVTFQGNDPEADQCHNCP